jgi:hypothetical protein
MLNNALDCGLDEERFWLMTFAELDRYLASKQRTEKTRQQDLATHNYILAGLIGRAYAASMDSNATFPELHEVFPSLFDGQKREQEKQKLTNELSALRFKQYADFHNKKFKEVANDK